MTDWFSGRNRGRTMTWDELKEAISKAGVKDDDEIWYIDVSFPEQRDFDKGVIGFSKDDKCGWGIG